MAKILRQTLTDQSSALSPPTAARAAVATGRWTILSKIFLHRHGAPRAVVATFVAAGLSACAGPRASIPYDPAGFGAPDPVISVDTTRQYRIGPGDVLTIQVYRAADLTGERTVDESGSLDMPLAGRVRAAGLLPTELADEIRRRLALRYYQNPKVTVSLKEAVGRRFTVDGSVRDPGIYPADAQTTLMRAVALANGEGDYANIRRVVVFRTVAGQRMAGAFDLRSVREGLTQDPAIYPGDVVVVDGDRTRQALRDVIQAIPLLAVFQPF